MKTVGGVSTIYVGKLYVCEAGICSRMIFANGQRIAEVETLSGAPRYYHTDHLGSTGVVTDSFGNNIQDITYYPFGQAYRQYRSADVRYKFTGKELDNSTDLYFYEARYYDAMLGRFVSADTVVPDPMNPQSLNRYSYAANNPVRYTDPSGHCEIVCIAIIAGAVIGSVSSGVQSDWDLEATLLGGVIGAVAGGVGGGVGGLAGGFLGAGTGSLAGISAGALAGALGGAAAGATSALLYRAAGYKVNIGKSAFSGAVFGAFAGAVGAHYGQTWDAGRVVVSALTSGVAGELTGGSFTQEFVTGLVISAVTYGAVEMRRVMVAQSKILVYDLLTEQWVSNGTGISNGFNGDGFKLGGNRMTQLGDGTYILGDVGKLGGHQSGGGSIFGIPYGPNGLANYVVEAFSGVHDWLNNGYWYDQSNGFNRNHTGWKFVFGEALNYVNVPLAAPAVALSVVGTSGLSYGSIATPTGRR